MQEGIVAMVVPRQKGLKGPFWAMLGGRNQNSGSGSCNKNKVMAICLISAEWRWVFYPGWHRQAQPLVTCTVPHPCHKQGQAVVRPGLVFRTSINKFSLPPPRIKSQYNWQIGLKKKWQHMTGRSIYCILKTAQKKKNIGVTKVEIQGWKMFSFHCNQMDWNKVLFLALRIKEWHVLKRWQLNYLELVI